MGVWERKGLVTLASTTCARSCVKRYITSSIILSSIHFVAHDHYWNTLCVTAVECNCCNLIGVQLFLRDTSRIC